MDNQAYRVLLSPEQIQTRVKELGEQIGVNIHLQHEGVFDAMHKV